ncbi:quinone oxidoreductase [Klebsiella pneumoniae]|uniref:Quinone oxidoreductase n=1 Tax=Klebsiella pneumoniae TaxID=573 RepID=A0A2X3FG55_KLEPN|nr:quinone oxidoreductase [Klebsiella pneumoniae]
MFLFHAAAGGVGLIACQWAKALGAKLIGTVGSAQKAQRAKEAGAWQVINYREESIVERLKALTDGKKVAVVYDSVGKRYLGGLSGLSAAPRPDGQLW